MNTQPVFKSIHMKSAELCGKLNTFIIDYNHREIALIEHLKILINVEIVPKLR